MLHLLANNGLHALLQNAQIALLTFFKVIINLCVVNVHIKSVYRLCT